MQRRGHVQSESDARGDRGVESRRQRDPSRTAERVKTSVKAVCAQGERGVAEAAKRRSEDMARQRCLYSAKKL